MSDPIYEGKTGHSREENVVHTRIKVEAGLQGAEMTTNYLYSPCKQSVEQQSHPMQIKQEELHIKDEIPNIFAAEDDVLNNTKFPSTHVKPFTEGPGQASKDNCEAGTSTCKTVRKANVALNTEIPTGSKTLVTNFRIIRCVYTGIKKFQCRLCKMKFPFKSAFNTHIRFHSGEKPFQCGLCEYKSAQKSGLKRHMLTHTGEKRFVCDLCEFKYPSKGNLERHMRIHRGEKPFECNLCQYKSVDKSNLKLHMKIHTSERPFVCDLCEFKSANNAALQKHMRKHTGEKPFGCNLCEFKSAYKSVLRTHMRIHTGENPFECNLCEFKSAHESHLKKHMSIHTGEKNRLSVICVD